MEGSRSLKQECPLSCILSIVIYLAIWIKQNQEIIRMPIIFTEEMMQFDSNTACLMRCCKLVSCTFDTLGVFSKYSGLHANIHKK